MKQGRGDDKPAKERDMVIRRVMRLDRWAVWSQVRAGRRRWSGGGQVGGGRQTCRSEQGKVTEMAVKGLR